MKPPKESLFNLFEIPGTTVVKAAKHFNVNEKTIRRWLKSYELKTRPMSETASIRQAVSSSISSKGIQVLHGELLGDGCLVSRSFRSARYTHTSKHEDYVRWLSEKLKKEGVEFSKNPVCKVLKGEYTGYVLRSKTQVELKDIHSLFYATGNKIIPKSLNLSPESCLHWYIGDGHNPKKYKRVILYPLCFHIESIEKYLLPQLSCFGARTRHEVKKMGKTFGYSIVLDYSFLDYIGKCPEEIEHCYGYKFKK
jgi:transposase